MVGIDLTVRVAGKEVLMNGDWITVAQQRGRWLLIPIAVFVLGGFLLMALASTAQAQRFDDEVARALANGCAAMGGNVNKGPNLSALCAGISGSVTASASSGSTTTLSREAAPIEEKKIQRLVGPFNVFVSGEYEHFDKDLTKFEPAYRTDTGRAVIGADYSFNDRVLLGAAFRYARDNGHFDAGGGFKTDSYGGLLHTSFVPSRDSFIDATAGYTRKNYSLERIAIVTTQFGGSPTKLGNIESDTDGNEYNLGLNGGYNFNFQSVTFGPRLGVNYRRTEIDGFGERGRRVPGAPLPGPGTGVELVYNSQHENSLTSVAGVYGSVAISTAIGVLVPQATVEYVHEFLDPQRKIRFRFVEDRNGTPFRFENDPPDRNYFNLGAGVVLVLPRGFSPFLNYRALVGYNDQQSHIFTAGLRVEF
jgi:outer membrane autotransporter protein